MAEAGRQHGLDVQHRLDLQPGLVTMKSSYCSNNGCVDVEFDKSSYSKANGNCVEVGQFRTSPYSASNGACVEVGQFNRSSHYADQDQCVEVAAETDDVNHEIVVRDSKDQDGPVLRFTPAEWVAFIKGVKDGEFDLTPELTALAEAELATV